MKNFISLINGKFKKSISVLDRGLAYGDGFFETMLWDSYNENKKLKVGVEFWENIFKELKRLPLNEDKFPYRKRNFKTKK